MMKRNVLELTGSFNQGGSERQALQLVRLLKEEASFKVFVGCLDTSGVLREEAEALAGEAIPEFKLTSFYDRNFFRQAKSCAGYIKQNGINVVHTHDFYTNIFGMFSAFLAGVPARIASKRETFSKTRSQFLMERQAFRIADRILANSEAVRKYLTDANVSSNKIVTIHNGLDLERVNAGSAVGRGELLSSLGIAAPENAKFVTMVANLRSDVKNHSMFLRAAQKVKNKLPHTIFVAAGDGGLIDEYKRYARDLGIEENVLFIGNCSRISELLSISDVCVLSSKSEGFSNSILEYMAAAKPVVATRVGGADEAIVEGETGFLVDSDDDEIMAVRIIKLLEDSGRAVKMGIAGRRIIIEKFSPGAQTMSVINLYEAVLGQTNRRRIYTASH